MAYSTSTPPRLYVGIADNSSPQFWTYDSTHTQAEVTTGAGFFTNGSALGMRLGDRVFGATTAYVTYVGAISAVTTTGCTLTS